MVIPKDAGHTQISESRQAFFAGAAILFHSIMSVMSEDKDPTEEDLAAMEAIHKELQEFGIQLDRKCVNYNEH